jgi:hypothetical protein
MPKLRFCVPLPTAHTHTLSVSLSLARARSLSHQRKDGRHGRCDLGGEVPSEGAGVYDEEEQPETHGVVHRHRPVHLDSPVRCVCVCERCAFESVNVHTGKRWGGGEGGKVTTVVGEVTGMGGARREGVAGGSRDT